MIVVYLFEFVIFVTVVVLMGTQVIAPLWRGTPVFPMFRKERRKLEEELSKAREASEEARLQREVKEERNRARRVRKGHEWS